MSVIVPSLKQAQALLYENILDPQIRKHCEATRVKANQIATLVSTKIRCNLKLVEIGSLLHDIGRARIHDVTHGYVGGQILQIHHYPQSVVKIVERHVLGGFSNIEATKVGLPNRDFIPQTLEEKIVCVADKLGAFEWNGIQQPHRWLTEVNNRLDELTKRYGLAEPYQTSMQRARHFTNELVELAISK